MTPQPKMTCLPCAALLALLLVAALTVPAAAQSATANPGSSIAYGDNDTTRRELNNFDRYLDDHPGIARELKDNPNLINDRQWLAQHPSTRDYLEDHAGVREEIRENPTQFMNRENRFERNGGDISRAQAASADRYLDKHPEVAEQLQKNPRLIDNPNYLAKHPELREYLNNHPEVKEDWKQHPYAFEKRQRQYERHEYKKPYAAQR